MPVAARLERENTPEIQLLTFIPGASQGDLVPIWNSGCLLPVQTCSNSVHPEGGASLLRLSGSSRALGLKPVLL